MDQSMLLYGGFTLILAALISVSTLFGLLHLQFPGGHDEYLVHPCS